MTSKIFKYSVLGLCHNGLTCDGWIKKDYSSQGNRLYVNRKIGFSDIPIRLKCRPEVTLFTLHSG